MLTVAPVLLTIRLYRYRRDFQYLVSAASTTRSRFMRLFLLALFTVFMVMPAQLVVIIAMAGFEMHPYSWSVVHNWDVEVRVPSNGHILEWAHLIWIPSGFLVFLFFGFGRDARTMYVGWLVKAGAGNIFPSLLEENQSPNGTGKTGLLSSMASKAKSLFTNSTVNSNKDSLYVLSPAPAPKAVVTNASTSFNTTSTTTSTVDPVKSYHLSQHSTHLSNFEATTRATPPPIKSGEASPSSLEQSPYSGGNCHWATLDEDAIVRVTTTCTSGVMTDTYDLEKQ
jgi:hypothetical protein